MFDTGLSTVIKRVETDYLLTKGYTDRNIIGLPSETRAFGVPASAGVFSGALDLISRATYGYDEGTFSQEPNQIIAPTRHDTANYGSAFTKRGNPTSTTRWEVPNNVTSVTSQVRYDIAGSPVAQIDPLNRKVRIGYTDNFSTTGNPATFAYPTTITDPAGTSLGDSLHSSTVKYRYDIGANVEAASPAPAGNTLGKKTARVFDSVGRLQQETIVNSGAYTRYEYPTNGIQSKVFSTIIDTNNNGADTLDEVMSESWADGAGRVRRSRTEHPGSIGGWSGSVVEYDILGRAKRQSVPTEILVPNANDPDTWAPAGDDATRGWLWTYQKYDWKGRVTRKINTDGTDSPVLNDSDVLISYEGCGCAGGQQTTIEAERVPVSGTSNFARRKQKVYEDILGRSFKTETYDWDGSTVYSTVMQSFNGRDQITQSRQYTGSTSSTTYQDTTATYDGHGRLASSHKPEQQNPVGTAAYTTYNYNTDDSISNVTDARGAVTNYVYNDPRGLLTQINYTSPNPTQIPVTPTVNFTYDNIGNRTSMTDGMGSINYAYDQLSRMTAETRQFSDTLTDPTVPVGGFKMEYFYGLSGQLKSYKDPYNRQFDFGFDKTGRSISVGGTAYAGVTSYASNNQYRAFGAVKQITYGNQTTATMTYNNRLQPTSYRLNDSTQTLFGKDYFYTTAGNNDNDGLIKKSVHVDATMTTTEQAKRNQVNTYDAQGRIKTSETGEPGLTPFGGYKNGPYQQSYTYDGFGNKTAKNDQDFGYTYIGCTGCPRTISYSETTTNNRTQSSSYYSSDGTSSNISNYQYDADGRLVNRDGDLAKFDAAGRMVLHDGTGSDDSYSYSGNGALTKWVQTLPPPSTYAPFFYYLESSVLGANVLELTSTGAMFKEYVFSGNGSQMAYLKDGTVTWLHEEPSGKERYEIKQDRTADSRITYDPTGAASTNGGYTGGTPCPPYTCSSPENNAMMEWTNRGFDGLNQLTLLRNAQWLQSNLFVLIERSFQQSNTPIGIRDRGVSWGRPFTATYGFDGSRTITFGAFNPSLAGVNYSNDYLVYSLDFSLISLISWQTQTREPNAYSLEKLLKDAEAIIKNATGECAKLLGKNALADFQEKKKHFEYDPKNLNVPSTSAARTYEDTEHVYLNPWHYVFNSDSRSIVPIPKGLKKKDREFYERRNAVPEFWAKEIKNAGVSEYSYAVGAILHEFLHQIGKFESHTVGTTESVEDQRKVIEQCIKGNEPK